MHTKPPPSIALVADTLGSGIVTPGGNGAGSADSIQRIVEREFAGAFNVGPVVMAGSRHQTYQASEVEGGPRIHDQHAETGG